MIYPLMCLIDEHKIKPPLIDKIIENNIKIVVNENA